MDRLEQLLGELPFPLTRVVWECELAAADIAHPPLCEVVVWIECESKEAELLQVPPFAALDVGFRIKNIPAMEMLIPNAKVSLFMCSQTRRIDKRILQIYTEKSSIKTKMIQQNVSSCIPNSRLLLGNDRP